MAFTNTDLLAVEEAIASGVLTVAIGEKRTTFQSVDGLLKARAAIQRYLDNQEASSKGGSSLYSVVDFR